MNLNGILWVILTLIVITLLSVLFVKLSANVRLRRRLRKARNRIVSKAPEPSIKFSVKTPKE